MEHPGRVCLPIPAKADAKVDLIWLWTFAAAFVEGDGSLGIEVLGELGGDGQFSAMCVEIVHSAV